MMSATRPDWARDRARTPAPSRDELLRISQMVERAFIGAASARALSSSILRLMRFFRPRGAIFYADSPGPAVRLLLIHGSRERSFDYYVERSFVSVPAPAYVSSLCQSRIASRRSASFRRRGPARRPVAARFPEKHASFGRRDVMSPVVGSHVALKAVFVPRVPLGVGDDAEICGVAAHANQLVCVLGGHAVAVVLEVDQAG